MQHSIVVERGHHVVRDMACVEVSLQLVGRHERGKVVVQLAPPRAHRTRKLGQGRTRQAPHRVPERDFGVRVEGRDHLGPRVRVSTCLCVASAHPVPHPAEVGGERKPAAGDGCDPWVAYC